MLPLVNRDWEGDLRANKTVWVRTPGSISMGSYSRGTVISYQDLTPVKEAFTVNDGEYFAFNVDDIDKAQSDIVAMDVYMKRAVVAMNNKVEEKLLATYTSAGVTLGSASAGTGGVLTPVLGTGTLAGTVASLTITAGGTGYTTAPIIQFQGGNGNGATATCTSTAGVISATTVTAGGNNYTVAPRAILTTAGAITLDGSTTALTGIYQVFTAVSAIQSNNNVPNGQFQRWAVIDPDTLAVLQNDTNHFIRAGNLGDQIVQYGGVGADRTARTADQAPGFVGSVLGYAVYVTPHTPRSGANKFLLFGDNEAISYAAQITEIEALRLQTTFANAIRGLLLHDTFVPAESAKRLVAVRAVA